MIAYEIAHIRDAKPGNRYVREMTDDERRAFPNLVLLCGPHHKLVDKIRPDAYSIQDLEAWKRAADPDGSTELSSLTDSDLEDARTYTALVVDADVINLGGRGGGFGGGGGGGAGILGGFGGPGGPGGAIVINDATRIELDGEPGEQPGGGGGGAGYLAPGPIIRNAAAPVAGRGYSDGVDGADGGDSTVSDDKGKVLVRAPGGKGALAGTGIRSTSSRIRVSTMLMASAWDQRDNLLYLLGAGWESVSVTNVGDPAVVGMILTFECAGVEAGEYTITVRAVGPDGEQAQVGFPLTVEKAGDILRVPRAIKLGFAVSAFGIWTLTVEHDGRILGTLDLNVKRTGEA